jgi:uncharacterized membrane protein YccC
MRVVFLNNKPLLYTFRILLGTLIVWWSLNFVNDDKKIWAVISVIVVSDPDFDAVRSTAISRVVNTIVGCLIGLTFMYAGGVNIYTLIAALTVSVLLSTSFKNYPVSWKLAPTTVAIIIIPAITGHEEYKLAMQVALERTAEILYGCFVAFSLGFILFGIRNRFEKKRMEKQIREAKQMLK